jgi:methionyl-tRNA formyltransferase
VRLDWQRSAPELERLIRASIGVERAHCAYLGMKIVVVEGSVLEHESRPVAASAPGTVLAITPAGIEVLAGDLDGEPTVLSLRRFVFLERAYDGAALAELVGMHPWAKLD